MENNKKKLLKSIDARTVLTIVLCTGVVTMFAHAMERHLIYTCFLVLLLILFGRWKQSILLFAVYGITIWGLYIELHYGILSFPSPLLLSIIYKMIPVGMSIYLLMTIPSGKLISGLRKIPMPSQIRLILVVMLRFVPTVVLEASEIRNSMRVRGLWGSVGTVIRHPMDTLEYAFVPMIFRSLKVSDELSASAVVRGIEYPGKKESYYHSHFHSVDYIFTAATLISCVLCCI